MGLDNFGVGVFLPISICFPWLKAAKDSTATSPSGIEIRLTCAEPSGHATIVPGLHPNRRVHPVETKLSTGTHENLADIGRDNSAQAASIGCHSDAGFRCLLLGIAVQAVAVSRSRGAPCRAGGKASLAKGAAAGQPASGESGACGLPHYPGNSRQWLERCRGPADQRISNRFAWAQRAGRCGGNRAYGVLAAGLPYRSQSTPYRLLTAA